MMRATLFAMLLLAAPGASADCAGATLTLIQPNLLVTETRQIRTFGDITLGAAKSVGMVRSALPPQDMGTGSPARALARTAPGHSRTPGTSRFNARLSTAARSISPARSVPTAGASSTLCRHPVDCPPCFAALHCRVPAEGGGGQPNCLSSYSVSPQSAATGSPCISKHPAFLLTTPVARRTVGQRLPAQQRRPSRLRLGRDGPSVRVHGGTHGCRGRGLQARQQLRAHDQPHHRRHEHRRAAPAHQPGNPLSFQRPQRGRDAHLTPVHPGSR